MEKALESITKFGEANARAWFQDLQDELTVARIDDGHPQTYYPVVATPPFEEWLQPEGWNTFTYRHTERALATLPEASHQPTAKHPEHKIDPSWLATVALSVQTKRVNLIRPWLSTAIFYSPSWRLSASCGFTQVASGNPLEPDPGLMPLMVTGVLLGRNLVIKGKGREGGQGPDRSDPPLEALGPFALATPHGGKGPGRPSRVTTDAAELSITCEAPQIIGFFCEALPKCPNPRPDFRP